MKNLKLKKGLNNTPSLQYAVNQVLTALFCILTFLFLYACGSVSTDTPTPVAEKITVSFDTQGGNTIPTQTITKGEKLTTKPSDPTKNNHTFNGWYTAATAGTKVNLDTQTFSAKTTLYARWTQTTFTITFALNGEGATGKPDNQTVQKNNTATKPPGDPVRTDYSFVGWYQSQYPSENESVFDFTSLITADMTLYARWTQGFIVTFDTQGGTPIENQTAPQGETATRPTDDPTREHYTFDNWYTTAETGGQVVTFPYTVTENITLYARWTRIQFTVTFNHNYGETPSTDAVMVNSGETASLLAPEPTRDHYTFDNWYTTAETAGQVVTFPYTPTDNVTIYARWTRIQFTITFNHNYGGTPSTDVVMVNSGETASPLAPEPTREGDFTFLNWYESTSETEVTLQATPFDFNAPITENKILYAKWTPRYVITFKTQGGSIISTQEILSTTNPKRAIKPKANPRRENYIFNDWFENPQGTGKPYNFDTPIQEDKTIYAIWSRILFAITFDKGYTPPTGTPQTTKEIINQQGQVYKIKPTRDKYIFKGWYTAQTGGEKIDLFTKQFEASTTLYAQWELVTISFNDGYGDPANVVTEQINAAGKIVGKAAPTRNPYTFSGWFTAQTGGEEVDLATNVFTAPTTLYAQWTLENTYTITFNDNFGTSSTTTETTNNDGRVTKTDPATRDRYSFKGWYTAATAGEKRDLLTYVFTENTTLFAQWELATITFNDGYGDPANVVTEQINAAGKIVGKANPTERNPYTFSGWFTAQTGGEEVDLATKVFTAPTTLYAQWTLENTYTITFSDNFGTSSTTTETTNNDGRVTKTDPATRDRYTFKGWYTATSGGEKRELLTYVFTEDTTLFAQWELVTITFNYRNSYPPTIVKKQINAEGKIVGKDAPTRNLYTFNGWFTTQTDGEQVTLTTSIFTAPTTLNAQWTRAKYVVTLNYNDGVPPLTEPAKIEVNPNDMLSTPTSPERTHYTLDSWHTSGSLSANRVFNFGNTPITDDMSLYAKWTRATYTVIFNYNDGKTPLTTSTVDSSPLGFVGKPSTPTHANNNLKFVNWYAKENPTETDTPFIFDTTLIVANMELYALWTSQKFIVSFNTIDGSDVPSQPITAGEAATRPNIIPIKKHFVFVTWVTQEEDGEIYDFSTTISADKTVYARWRHRPETRQALTAEIEKAITDHGRNVDLNYIDTSLITDMSKLFASSAITVTFNGDISTWNVSNVTNMNRMFSAATAFNQNISSWNVSKVTNMEFMFASTQYNQDISNWNVSLVENMSFMFNGTRAFNQNIGNWNVSKVTNMSDMFNDARAFNQNISSWNVSLVENMNSMFTRAIVFNQNISNWNVSKVTNMEWMFSNATAFNGNISNWRPTALTNMSNMFKNASAFTQNINSWNIASIVDKTDAFTGSGLETSLPTWAR